MDRVNMNFVTGPRPRRVVLSSRDQISSRQIGQFFGGGPWATGIVSVVAVRTSLL